MTKKEKLQWWVVKKLPKKIVYLCAIDVGAYATSGKYSSEVVPDLKFFDAIERFEKGHRIK